MIQLWNFLAYYIYQARETFSHLHIAGFGIEKAVAGKVMRKNESPGSCDAA